MLRWRMWSIGVQAKREINQKREMSERSFEGAWDKLQTLTLSKEDAAALIKRRRANLTETQEEEMLGYVAQLGLTESLQSLPVVHIAGTKGKGSTAAFTERLIRFHGYKTGLFTSPHLIHPC